MPRRGAGGGSVASTVDPMSTSGERVLTLEELTEFGVSLGRALAARGPNVVTLSGDLGTGKTTLTRAIGRGFGVVEPVTSPTFALVHEYAARHGRRLFHLDLYRIKGPHELANIGWESLLEAPALLIIEWPDRAGELIPPNAMAITLAHVEGDETRRLVTW
ncbi:MAG: tRNA (adenosine(37)-N6)-threonylcarbamoyltransferase complex ATPase subunit type 1 TsaE [Gemmatimonas sp.]|nr:tRNA (adenosine(37)-N6)-threonylcarbamoyltransferase complex ATPase subunit type 1 TsaE [Gemmatimonas sp.]